MKDLVWLLLKQMTVGLPVISFDCPQGPSEMVNTDNGFDRIR